MNRNALLGEDRAEIAAKQASGALHPGSRIRRPLRATAAAATAGRPDPDRGDKRDNRRNPSARDRDRGKSGESARSASCADHVPADAMPAICWHSTSSGWDGTCNGSHCAARPEAAVTTASSSSAADDVNTRPRGTRPGPCPARPTRCSNRTTSPGGCTSAARSTEPTSMPSSRLVLLTTTRSRPSLKLASISRRRAAATDEWWTAI